MQLRILTAVLAVTLAAGFAQGQTITPDSLNKRVSAIEHDFGWLKNLKITGYVQAQWQKADTTGAKILGGGGLPANSDNKFSLRRGRVKFTFSQKHMSLNVQPELTERGVTLRDFFATVTEPWTGHFSLTMGQFNRPVSFELLNPSAIRETPDRARACQWLYPDEREIGAMLSFKKGAWKADAALVNGNAQAIESDKRKDFIGRLSWTKKLGAHNQLSAAASVYDGGVRQGTKFAYETTSSRAGMVLKYNDSTALGRFAKRQYFGGDAQYTHQWTPGATTLRAEFVTGTQTSTATASESPKTSTGLVGDAYSRPMMGGIFYLIQNLGKSHFQAVVKYDFFDGNTRARGDEIGQTFTQLGAGDLRWDTWGLGLNFYWENLTLMGYYDIVKNETSANLPAYRKDLKDNVLTLRMQVRF